MKITEMFVSVKFQGFHHIFAGNRSKKELQGWLSLVLNHVGSHV
jgi:hypothetical protein